MTTTPPDHAYFPVSTRKFVVLSVLTLGIYEFYWFYKCWQYVNERDGGRLSPVWRTLFAPLWVYSLQRDVEAHAPAGVAPSLGAVPAAVSYFALSAVSWRLPDPYWIVSIFTFAPLLPLVVLVNESNPPGSAAFVANSAWRPRHLALALAAGPMIALGVGSTLALLPPTQVIPGSRLWAHDRAFLESEGIIAPGEEILEFYSEALLSIHEMGTLLTDRAVVAYGADAEDGERWRERAAHAEVDDVRSGPSEWSGFTTVTVVRLDGSEFTFDLSSEAGGNVRFLDELDRRRRAARATAP